MPRPSNCQPARCIGRVISKLSEGYDHGDLAIALILGVAMATFAMHPTKHSTSSSQLLYIVPFQAWAPIQRRWISCCVSSPPKLVNVCFDPKNQLLELGSTQQVMLIVILGSVARCWPLFITYVKLVTYSDTKWQPLTPANFPNRFTQPEVTIMLAQARILRLSALLIIHRLRHPFVQCDREAIQMSKSILEEFGVVIKSTGRSIPCTGVACQAACFKLIDLEERRAVLARSQSDIILETFCGVVQDLFDIRVGGARL
ncbi:hypothetical protein N7510_010536 [Penicillium lagena]|uniref:uncharacterized protein n=1 Tax=Penicillium lagena TaxID=94218 RepID=UPI0025400E04|nr:uncharacterized protein N7510_010536 [Penicillium lagena]KAJ5601002.1 hypothetical protein N7510_010536 [Penicillium lagena]